MPRVDNASRSAAGRSVGKGCVCAACGGVVFQAAKFGAVSGFCFQKSNKGASVFKFLLHRLRRGLLASRVQGTEGPRADPKRDPKRDGAIGQCDQNRLTPIDI